MLAIDAPCPGLFRDVAWSTAGVAETTMTRARELGLDADDLALVRRLARTVGIGAPIAEQARKAFAWPGAFRQLRAAAVQLQSGHVGAALIWHRADFAVTWSNPLWAALEVPVSSQEAQVLDRISRSIQRPPVPLDLHEWQEEALVRVPGHWVSERLGRCVPYLGVRRGLDNAVCLGLGLGGGHDARLLGLHD